MAGRIEVHPGACPGSVASRSTLSAVLGLVGTLVETDPSAPRLAVCRTCLDGSAWEEEVVLVLYLFLVEGC